MLLCTRHRIFGRGLATTALLLVTGLLGCRPPQSTGVQTQFRDSAGITIVESSSPEWLEGEGWVVEPDPLVTFGERDGPTEYLFSKIRSVSFWPGRDQTSAADVCTKRSASTVNTAGRFGVVIDTHPTGSNRA